MHPKAIEKLASRMTEIAKFVSPVGEGNFLGILMHDEVMYQLPIDHQREFNSLVMEFLKKQEWSEKFSEEYILKKLKKIFASILKEETGIADKIQDLVNELNSYDIEMTVYLPVGGIILNAEFSLGNITLQSSSEVNLEDVKNSLNDVVSIAKNKEEENKAIYETFSNEIEKEFKGFCISKYAVIAESSRAYERAKEETRRALELLRFSSKFLYPRNEDVRIGLKGESIYGTRTAFVLSNKSIATKSDQEGSIRSFTIDPQKIEGMSKLGIMTHSEILKKNKPTNFEESLLRSLHWFSSAIQQTETENAFLCLIISLEAIFKSVQGNPIANSVAEGVAILLAEDLETRKRLKKTIKEYYGMRSGVSHGGNKVIMESDYYTLMNIVGSVIVILTEKIVIFPSQNSFMEWIEDLKLT